MRARTLLGLVAVAALAACGAPAPTDPSASVAVPTLDGVETPPDTTGGDGSGYLGSGNNTTPPNGGS